jgi:hypothetical protein
MEAFSCAAAAASLARNILSTIKGIDTICEKYKDAHNSLGFLKTEVTTISLSVQRIRFILDQPPGHLQAQVDGTPELKETFAAAFAACELIICRLAQDIEGFQTSIGATDPAPLGRLIGRAKFVWKEDSLRDLLQALRGQNESIMFLVQCLQV